MATPAAKDKITCHVLDTTAGRPAKGIRVRLEGGGPSSSSSGGTPTPLRQFESTTDDDGRVKAWLPYSSDRASGEVPVYTLDDVMAEVEAAAGDSGKQSRWTLRFDTAAYFGEDKTFFPEVTVVFAVQPGQHYHVPLLLSPYSYTTYRGS